VYVSHGVLDILMPEKLLDVERIHCPPRFHCCFKVAQSFETYAKQPGIFKFVGYPLSLQGEVSAMMIEGHTGFGEYSFSVFSWQVVKHFRQFF